MPLQGRTVIGHRTTDLEPVRATRKKKLAEAVDMDKKLKKLNNLHRVTF